MKKIYVLAAIITAATAFSCTKNTVDEPQVQGMVKFTCTLQGTKVDIDNDGKTKWEVGDQIFVHAGTNGDKSITITLAESDIHDSGKTATISFLESELAPYDRSDKKYVSQYFAIYPASAAGSGNMYYETRFNDFSEPVMGGYDDGAGHMIFRNLCSAVRFKVSGNFDSYDFVGANGEIVAYTEYQVRLVQTTTGELREIKLSGNGYSGSSLTVASGSVTADGTTDNWLVFPMNLNLTNGFTFKFKKSGSTVKTATVTSTFALNVGDYFNMGDISDHLKDYVAPTTSDHESAITGATDLSTANGPANCYVISTPGAYKLPVVKGNDSETSAGNVFGVELLWETYNNAETVTAKSVIAAVDYDGPENYIYFKTPDTLKPGNALIAAKDSEGNIIWSWHIWIPETAFTTSTFGGISSRAMMDRNLGAIRAATAGTDDIQTMGLLYQWGRKDPFPNKKNHSSSGNDFTNHATTAPTSALSTVSEQFASVADAIKSPTVFVANPADKIDWTAVSNNAFWTTTKTIYDPCPPGYKVPSSSECNMFTKDITDTANYSGWSVDVSNCQFTLGSSTDKTVFPTGYLYHNGRWDVPNERAVIWSATYESEYRAVNLYVKISDGSYTQYKRSRSTGGSVRCVAE